MSHPFYRFRFFIAVSLLLFLTILACGSNAKPEKVGESNPAQPQEPAAAPAQTQTYKVGDIVQIGDVALTVNGVSEPAATDFAKPKDGSKFIVVDLTIENKSAKAAQISTMLQMKLKDDTGQQYDINLMTQAASGGKSPDGEIAPGEKIRGQIGFEIPTGAKGLVFVFDADIFGSGKVFVNL